jgi:hypothetical protein
VAVSYLSVLEVIWCSPLLWWANTVCYVMALGAAYAVQGTRWRVGASNYKPRTLLWAGTAAVLLCGSMAGLVPGIAWFAGRRDAVHAP